MHINLKRTFYVISLLYKNKNLICFHPTPSISHNKPNTLHEHDSIRHQPAPLLPENLVLPSCVCV